MSKEAKCVRKERFFLPEKLCNKAFHDWNWTVAEFIHKWKKDNISEQLEKTAEGILIEGNKTGEYKDAQWLAEQLRSAKGKSEDEIYKLCISLYTYECFLYKLINQTLRDDDYSKIQTCNYSE
ncbi:unnamed protein product [Didymodactylos carnosus]|uniref:Uncharacterized protein n=1 Tax=Didymodactylos carnosus TaxID=1234261 RepID=A0A815ZWB3_9BILA|nr:unnamed protein product [Didymodactylos carnosus]CAF4461604.1 unnamed protein product [Didymodactylos carnosus]